MAAPETIPAPVAEVHTVGDDDDAWLYGDEGKDQEAAKEDKPESSQKADELPKGVAVKKEDREEGEMSGEEGESQEKDDDDDSDEDDVQVTIGDIKAWSASEQQPRNLFKSGTTYQKPATGTPAKPTTTTKGLDVEAQGTINGVPVYEFDLNSIEEKPWRKPGADITDYFNYGFTEETWLQYCEKQRRLITLNESTPKIITQSNNISLVSRPEKDMGLTRTRVQPPLPVVSKPQVGTIDVIGGTAKDSRRPDEGDPIPVAGVASHTGRKFVGVPGLPPTSIPPPHLPPVDYTIPPPGLPPHAVPPPGMALPPPGFPPVANPFDPEDYSLAMGCGVVYSTRSYSAFYSVPPPDRSMPPPVFEDRPPFSYGGPSHPTFGGTFSDSSRPPGSQWESGSTLSEQDSRDREWERERERREGSRRDRDRSPAIHRPEEDFGREMKYRPHDREREREREQRERDRERDRDRKRDREGRRRSRSPDRERELDGGRRDREEDKHRSRRSDARRHKGEDSDTESTRSSSKHKKSRRRRDKEEDGGEGDETPSKGD